MPQTPVKPGTLVIDVETRLRGPLAETLVRHAEARKLKPVDLLARVIETVLADDLVAAVLDT